MQQTRHFDGHTRGVAAFFVLPGLCLRQVFGGQNRIGDRQAVVEGDACDGGAAFIGHQLEVASALQALAAQQRFDALIALGCIIRGETYHFELVANESGAAVTRVGLDHRLPIANAILTTEDLAQAQARQDEKGRDAARVAVEMARLLQSLKPS